MHAVSRLFLLMTPLLLTGCSEQAVEEIILTLGMWILFLLVALVVATIGLVAVVMVLLAPPFAGLVSGVLLRRDASPRRRGFVVAVGLLNLSNFALFVLPCIAMMGQIIAPPEPLEEYPDVVMTPEVSPVEDDSSDLKPMSEQVDELILVVIALSILLVLNLGAGVYSLSVGLRIAEEEP